MNIYRENICGHRWYRSHSSIARPLNSIVNAIAFRVRCVRVCRLAISGTHQIATFRFMYVISLLFSFSSPCSISLSQRDNRVSPRETSITDNHSLSRACEYPFHLNFSQIFLRLIRCLHRIETSFGERPIFGKGAEWRCRTSTTHVHFTDDRLFSDDSARFVTAVARIVYRVNHNALQRI